MLKPARSSPSWGGIGYVARPDGGSTPIEYIRLPSVLISHSSRKSSSGAVSALTLTRSSATPS